MVELLIIKHAHVEQNEKRLEYYLRVLELSDTINKEGRIESKKSAHYQSEILSK